MRHPALLLEEVSSLQTKVDYFHRFYLQLSSNRISFSSLKASLPVPLPPRLALLHSPQYLLLSFEDVIQPRSDFLLQVAKKRMNSQVLTLKTSEVIQLLTVSVDEFCRSVGVSKASYESFMSKRASLVSSSVDIS